MGQPIRHLADTPTESEGQPGELKHLSSRRNRERCSTSLSSGERTVSSANSAPINRPEGSSAPVIPAERRRRGLESRPTEGERPVDVSHGGRGDPLSRTGPEKSCPNRPVPSGKAKYCL